MKKMIIKFIKLYQKTPLACHGYCKYYPTCSNYAIEAINSYGILKGGVMAVKRIMRCNPFVKGGYDPVIKEEI